MFVRVLQRRTQLACLSIMLGRAGDPDVEPDGHVRGNAIRALGHWVTVPALYSDAGFVSDVVNRAMALCAAKEDAHLVQSHAAWCLANAVEVRPEIHVSSFHRRYTPSKLKVTKTLFYRSYR